MDVFIDANVLVGFFELSKDSLAELEKLIAVVKSGGATLLLPEQAKREFWKNRENNIKRHVREFEQHRALGDAPLLVRETPKFSELVKDARQLDERRREIVAIVKSEVDSQETHADKIIRKLFQEAKPIDTDKDDSGSSSFYERRPLLVYPTSSKRVWCRALILRAKYSWSRKP